MTEAECDNLAVTCTLGVEPLPLNHAKVGNNFNYIFAVTVDMPYWVLDTDYTSYALVYSCQNINAEYRRGEY